MSIIFHDCINQKMTIRNLQDQLTELPYPMMSLQDATWSQIKEISELGLAEYYWKDGDEKTFQLSTGVVHTVRIIGKGLEYTPSGYPIGLTFEFTSPIGQYKLDSDTETVPYANCSLRTQLNSTIFSSFPDDLQSAICETSVATLGTDSTRPYVIQKVIEKLYLPSVQNLGLFNGKQMGFYPNIVRPWFPIHAVGSYPQRNYPYWTRDRYPYSSSTKIGCYSVTKDTYSLQDANTDAYVYPMFGIGEMRYSSPLVRADRSTIIVGLESEGYTFSDCNYLCRVDEDPAYAINCALASLPLSGGIVRLMPGDYNIQTSLIGLAPRTKLCADILSSGSAVNNNGNIVYRGVNIMRTAETFPAFPNNAMISLHGDDSVVSNLYIWGNGGAYTNEVVGIRMNKGGLRHCRFLYCKGYPCYVTINNLGMYGNEFMHNYREAYINYNYVNIHSNHFESVNSSLLCKISGFHGTFSGNSLEIREDGYTGLYVDNENPCSIIGNIFYGGVAKNITGIALHNTYGGIVANNLFYGYGSGNFAYTINVGSDSDSCEKLLITSNSLLDKDITITAGTNITKTNNNVFTRS